MKVTLKNLYYDTSIDIDQDSFTCMLDDNGIDWGTADASFTTINDIKGYGSKVSFTSYQTRSINIIGWLAANDSKEIPQLKYSLSRLMNPSHELELICEGYKIKCRAASSVRYSTEYRYNNEVLCKFSLDFEAHYPFFTYEDPEIIVDSKTINGIIFPWVIPESGDLFDLIPENNLAYINNVGDIDVGFVLYCDAVRGPTENIKVINNKTDQYIEIPIFVDKGETLIISTLTGDKYVKLQQGEEETDVTYLVTRNSEFWQLLSGFNDIEIQAINKSNIEFSMHYTPSFMEVVQ